MKDKTIRITRTGNGFVTEQDGFDRDNGEAVRMAHSFESFESLTDFLRHSIDNVRAVGWSGMRKHFGTDTCAPDQTAEQIRDEVGELRRFKENAEKRGAEQNKTIAYLTDQAADFKGQRDDYHKRWSDKCVESEAAEELAGNLQAEIQELKKKSRRRKR